MMLLDLYIAGRLPEYRPTYAEMIIASRVLRLRLYQ